MSSYFCHRNMGVMVVCAVLAIAACAFASEAQAGQSPARVALERMCPAERASSLISVEFESSDSGAVLLGREVERLWNDAQFDDALMQLGNLEARVGHVAIGNSWRKPVPMRETGLWEPAVRVGDRDSLLGLSCDVGYGNYFVALLHCSGPAYYSIWMSTDYGATWAETYMWFGGEVTLLDAAVLGTHFYVAYYSSGENAQQIRLRRFLMSDGLADEFSTGVKWIPACTLDMGSTAREVSCISGPPNLLFISTLLSDGSVQFSQSDEAAVSWVKYPTGITSGASRGLSGTRGWGASYCWLSYLDTMDTLRICYVKPFGHGYGQIAFAPFCGPSALTSISAAHGEIICAYEEGQFSPPRVLYVSSTDGGANWSTGTLSDTSVAAGAPAVNVGPFYGGFAALYRQESSTPDLQFRYCTDSAPWSDPVSIADNAPYRSRPSLLSLGGVPPTQKFGVVYLSDNSLVVRGAYFVSGWVYGGIAEQRRAQALGSSSLATVVRGTLFLPGLGTQAEKGAQAASLLDISGRRVLGLHPGVNDVSKLSPGVYFVREARTQARAARKVIVGR